jgi:hypothetical protein
MERDYSHCGRSFLSSRLMNCFMFIASGESVWCISIVGKLQFSNELEMLSSLTYFVLYFRLRRDNCYANYAFHMLRW